jgi:hypothetical protein
MTSRGERCTIVIRVVGREACSRQLWLERVDGSQEGSNTAERAGPCWGQGNV